MLELYGPQCPDVRPGDMATIRQPLDYLGVNFYRRSVMASGDDLPPVNIRRVRPEGSAYTAMDWEVSPRGLYDILKYVHEGYDAPPLFVTENGAAFEDTVTAGRVHDPDRTAYLAAHFAEAARAVRDGIPLKGYFVWTLLDNFEWAEGYSKRFGVVYTDYTTQARTVKDSGRYLAQVAASQTVTPPEPSGEVNVA